jgi:hypothetical protein
MSDGDFKALRERLDTITVSLLVAQIQADLLLALIEEVGKHTGHTHIAVCLCATGSRKKSWQNSKRP